MCGKGSCIAFDYFDESCFNSTVRKRTKMIGEPRKFDGMNSVDTFIRDCNAQVASNGTSDVLQLEVKDQLRCDELKRRYLARSNERYVGYLSEDFGGFLLLGSSPPYKAKVLLVPGKSDIGPVLADGDGEGRPPRLREGVDGFDDPLDLLDGGVVVAKDVEKFCHRLER